MNDLPPTADGYYPLIVPIEVCDKFEEIALMLRRERHFRRFSADAICHQIRWFNIVEQRRTKFKINNDWTAVLARWFISKHPEMSDFFELREKIGKASEWIDHDE